MSFYITNFPQFLKDPKDAFDTNLIDKDNFIKDEILFHIDGYIIPRMQIFDEYKNKSQYELLSDLYKRHGDKFINYIKGIFIILIIENDKFFLYNDRHSIKKVFIYSEEDYFYISNDLKKTSKNFSLTLDKENAATFCLLNHFLTGHTLFNKTTCSGPAEVLKFSDHKLSTSIYWNPQELFDLKEVAGQRDRDFSYFWDCLIKGYIEYLKPREVSITLTGGNDSRMVLAPILNNKYSLHGFSFGNPQSFDCEIAKKVAFTYNIRYQNYFVSSPGKEWLLDQSMKLIDIGNTLINLHRAHRNDALEKEVTSNPDIEMIFSGLMGGEYLKEPDYDDIVLPKLYQKLFAIRKKDKSIRIIKEQLWEKGINAERIDSEVVFEKIMSFLERNFNSNPQKRKFILTYYHYGCSHHSQDASIFNFHGKHGVNPFMDIDFLERISASSIWYVNTRKNPFRKFFHSKLYVQTTHDLAPGLSRIPYAKRGQYTANDLLNHPITYLYKRSRYLFVKEKKKYPPNFPMGNWLYDFSKEQIERLHPVVVELFMKDILIDNLENTKKKTTEGQWLPVTNPINLSMYLKAYENN